MPELDISYYFTPNLAAELILGTTFSNIETAARSLVSARWAHLVLPPTLTLQYHFTNFGAFHPTSAPA